MSWVNTQAWITHDCKRVESKWGNNEQVGAYHPSGTPLPRACLTSIILAGLCRGGNTKQMLIVNIQEVNKILIMDQYTDELWDARISFFFLVLDGWLDVFCGVCSRLDKFVKGFGQLFKLNWAARPILKLTQTMVSSKAFNPKLSLELFNTSRPQESCFGQPSKMVHFNIAMVSNPCFHCKSDTDFW